MAAHTGAISVAWLALRIAPQCCSTASKTCMPRQQARRLGLASQTCDVCAIGKVPACALSSWISALLGTRAMALSQSLNAAGKSPASALSFLSTWQHGIAKQAPPHTIVV